MTNDGSTNASPCGPFDGGPAFPQTSESWPHHTHHVHHHVSPVPSGMSLLDWFAGKAMARYPYVDDDDCDRVEDNLGKWCYQDARNMLAERERLAKGGED